jgi:hypothetical protein
MSPRPKNPSQKPAPPPLRFGEPEKPNWLVRALFLVFLIVSIGGIIAMVVTDPRDKPLNCRSDVPASLIGFGSCTTE